jgi:tetratricopeptide (TPR) repeat protein
MKYLRYTFLLGLALLTFTACEDRLELQPAQSIDGSLATATEANVQNILIGAYAEAGKDESYGGQLQIMADLLGGGDLINWVGTFIDPRQVINKNMLTDNGFITLFWNNHYATINQANLVLDNLDVVTSSDETRNRIEGEARFLRGLCYFDLVRHFAYDDMGVPLRTTGISDYSVNLAIDRASTSAVYDLILGDLNQAVSLLPETNSFFADRYSAQALLARVHLQLGNYADARDAANSVIENSDHSLEASYADAFNNDSDGAEDVFAFQVTSQDGQNDLINHYADEGNGGRGGDIPIPDAFLDLFEEGDFRGTFFYESAQSGDRLTGKYTNQFGNIPLIRLAEVHLIRAETNLREGTEVGLAPVDEINAIRTRSGASAITTEELDVDFILEERKRELAYEGFFIHDVVRTGGSVDGIPAGDERLTMPIPQSEIDTNTDIQQNPGYVQ